MAQESYSIDELFDSYFDPFTRLPVTPRQAASMGCSHAFTYWPTPRWSRRNF